MKRRQNSNQIIKARLITSALVLANRPLIRTLKIMPNDFLGNYSKVCYDLKVIVCGAIANKGISKIRKFQSLLKEKGFHVIDQVSDKYYGKIKDFRDKKKLAEEIVKHDLDSIKESDVVVALIDRPSFGVAIEIYFATILGKKVIIMSKRRVPSPWPIAFSDKIVHNEERLILALRELQS